jgi:hypothetical protein
MTLACHAMPCCHALQEEATQANRLVRQRLRSANPSELLVRHEMWLQLADPKERSARPAKTLVHYLGDAAFQNLSIPPVPVIVEGDDGGLRAQRPGDAISAGDSVLSVQLLLRCRVSNALGSDGGSDGAPAAEGADFDETSDDDERWLVAHPLAVGDSGNGPAALAHAAAERDWTDGSEELPPLPWRPPADELAGQAAATERAISPASVGGRNDGRMPPEQGGEPAAATSLAAAGPAPEIETMLRGVPLASLIRSAYASIHGAEAAASMELTSPASALSLPGTDELLLSELFEA